MNVTILPTRLKGSITPPPSKSQAHRLLIAAALSGGGSRVSNLSFSQDIRATLNCMEALGVRTEQTGPAEMTLHGLGGGERGRKGDLPRLHCGESGSTLRFLIPIALAVAGGGVFTGEGRLMERPQKPYFDLFDRKGIACRLENGVLTVEGKLLPGVYELPGNVSSQFITGLLYALPLLAGESEIRLTTPLESAGYVTMTVEALKHFGVEVKELPNGWRVPGGQRYHAIDAAVEPDWSQAGFWYAAAGVGNDVTVTGMDRNSCQGDRVIARFDEMLRNKPLSGGGQVPILGKPGGGQPAGDGSGRYAVSLDVSPCPDLVPPLAAWGALLRDGSGRPGDLYIENAGRLRIKESDRLAAVTAVLRAMGADIEEGADSLTIFGKERLPGGVSVESFNDHRIAMMAAIAATRCEQPVTILGAQCVNKSYPSFWEDYAALGGKLEIN